MGGEVVDHRLGDSLGYLRRRWRIVISDNLTRGLFRQSPIFLKNTEQAADRARVLEENANFPARIQLQLAKALATDESLGTIPDQRSVTSYGQKSHAASLW